MNIKTGIATLAIAAVAVTAIAASFAMNLSADGSAYGLDGSSASIDLEMSLEPDHTARRMGSVTLYSAKGSPILNFVPQTVSESKYSDDTATVQGVGLIRNYRGLTFKASYRIHAFDAERSGIDETDRFEIELYKVRGGPIFFSGFITKGDVSLWPSK